MTESKRCDLLARILDAVAADLGVLRSQVQAAADLLDAGNTVPFIARYRKEPTAGLDEVALRAIEDALERESALVARKSTVLKSIAEQGQLSDALRDSIDACRDMRSLEEIYLPFKPKRRTRATIARERGLQPLADLLLREAPLAGRKSETLNQFVNAENSVPDAETALQGGLDIVAEHWSEDAGIRNWLMKKTLAEGLVTSQLKRGKRGEVSKFDSVANRQEAVKKIPSHRLLAMLRGEAEGILKVAITIDPAAVIAHLKSHFVREPSFAFHTELLANVEETYERLLRPAIQSMVMQILKEQADQDAIGVFEKNLRELLMAAPAGPRVTVGIDPGYRTGCKVAVVDGTGKFLESITIYPTPPRNETQVAADALGQLIRKHNVELLAIGNGTASRETDAFVAGLIRDHNLTITKVIVSESGASIYSASELAGREFPNLDITVRGAISIARRLQDPLAELVKIDPKSIGVGQYQHDVNQNQLRKCLERTVESCVNQVGVDLNTASVSLLSHVAGIGHKLAENIVDFRNRNGRFKNRHQLTNVAKVGPRAFEQAAGFLRIRDGEIPLDDSAVHPESYTIVQRMAKRLGADMQSLVGNATLSQKLRADDFVDEHVGLPTVVDILSELAKPGRDPRSEFRAVQFDETVTSIDDLRAGMILSGVITNVTHFGAFVDIGVHQDALIHISQLSDAYVTDPSDVASVGDIVKVKLLEIDKPRKRISVTRKF